MSLGAFAASVAFAHLINPSVNPLAHMVSEYARYGPRTLVTAAFGFWAFSLTATAAHIATNQSRNHVTRAIVALLATAAVGTVVLASFRTQTSAGHLAFGTHMGAYGRLHDLGSGTLTLALFVGACLSLATEVLTARARYLIAVLLVVAAASDIALLTAGESVGGLRQRLLIGVGILWQLVLLQRHSWSCECTGIRQLGWGRP